MSLNGKTILGCILLFIGASMVLGMLGIHVSGLVGLLLAAGLCWFGIKSLTKGNKAIGVIALIFGLLILSGSLPFLIGLALSLVCIYYGWKMLNNKGAELNSVTAFSEDTYQTNDSVILEDSFEEEWKQFIKNKKDD